MPKQLLIDAQERCPRCQQVFICKASSISSCQCSNISLNKEQRNYIRHRYTSCLCINCLKQLQEEYLQIES